MVSEFAETSHSTKKKRKKAKSSPAIIPKDGVFTLIITPTTLLLLAFSFISQNRTYGTFSLSQHSRMTETTDEAVDISTSRLVSEIQGGRADGNLEPPLTGNFSK